MGRCLVCDKDIPDIEILDHLRGKHPVEYGKGLAYWPDGDPVIYDATLRPVDFRDGQ